jgi:cytochrome c oxidase subunit II
VANLAPVTGHPHRLTPSTPENPRPRRVRRIIATPAALLLGALALGGCQVPTFGAFRGATAQGKDEFKLWTGFAISGLVVLVLVGALILWAALAYRRKGPDHFPKQFHEHIPLEITYTVIPFVIVGVLFAYTAIVENKVDAVSTHPNEVVHVVAYRWGWRFNYEDGSGRSQNVLIQTTAKPKALAQPATSSEYPQLVLPDNATIRIVLDSADVVHGFYIPEFNFSRYAQPGFTNIFDFTTTTAGVFTGQCSQFCGIYHSEMLFSVRVTSQSSFNQWLTAQQAQQGASGIGAGA